MEAMKNICRSSGPVAEVYLHIVERREDDKIFLVKNLIESLILILSDQKIRSFLITTARQPDETRQFSTAFAQLLKSSIEFFQMSPESVKGRLNWLVKYKFANTYYRRCHLKTFTLCV